MDSSPGSQPCFCSSLGSLTRLSGLFILIFLSALTPEVEAGTLTLQEGLSVITSQGYEMRIARAREAAAAKGQDLALAHLRPQVNAYADHTWLHYQHTTTASLGNNPRDTHALNAFSRKSRRGEKCRNGTISGASSSSSVRRCIPRP